MENFPDEAFMEDVPDPVDQLMNDINISIWRAQFRRCVDSLWKKEENSDLYVELIGPQYREPVIEQLKSNRAPAKNNTIADDLLAEGFELLKGGERWLAMDKFNKALCFAEKDSEQVSIAYGDRAETFLELNKFDNCLIDVVLALQSSYPQRYMDRLLKCRDACIAKRSSQRNRSRVPRLSYPSNPDYPGMADVLEIKQSEEFGRYIVAKTDIPMGSTVLLEPSFMPANPFHGSICANCFRGARSFIACPNCTTALFCTKQCMESGAVYHATECGYIFCSEQLGRIPQYLIRSVSMGINICGGVDQLIAFVETVRQEPPAIPTSTLDPLDRYRAFLQLQINKRVRNSDDMKKLAQAYVFITTMPATKDLFNTEAKKRFLMHLIVMHDFIITDNRIGGLEYGDVSVRSLGLIESLFNHRCLANVTKYKIAGNSMVITVRPVNAGDQLYLCYAMNAVNVPRQEVRRQYGFMCKCTTCVPVSVERSLQLRIRDDPDNRSLYTYFENMTDNALFRNPSDVPLAKQLCVRFLKRYVHHPGGIELTRATYAFSICLAQEYDCDSDEDA